MNYKFSEAYHLLQRYVNIFFRLHFRKLHYIGKENIPENQAVVFAPTHRNALVDALILVNDNIKRQVVFLARADIFKAGFLSKVFTFMRIMPVYRIRDGKDNLSKNEEIFKQSGEVLKQGSPLCLFPEAIHNPNQNLLPLKKGIPRIVLPTEAAFNFQLNTHIVPVAFYYTNKDQFLSDLYVTYGKAIELKAYKEIYNENENLAINNLRKEMESELRKYVVDIPNEDYDELLAMINAKQMEVLEKSKGKNINLPEAAQGVLSYMKEMKSSNLLTYQNKINLIRDAVKSLQAEKLRPSDLIHKEKSSIQINLRFLFLILISPLALIGLVNSILPILVYKKLLRIIKDKQFISSIRIVSGIFILPLFYILQSIVVWIVFTGNLALIYFVFSPILFYFASYWRKWWKENLKARRLFLLKKKELWNLIHLAFAMK